MKPRTRAGVSAGAGAAIGVALATVVLPQRASALNPTGWGTLAVTVVVGLLGAAVSLLSPHRGRSRVCFGLAGAVAAATLALYLVQPHVMRKPRAISSQIEATLGRLLDHSKNHVVVEERVTLHPSEAPSWVVVIQHASNSTDFETDTEADPPAGSPSPVSDELRIYDVDDGWLTLKLDYRPAGRGTMARYWTSPAGAPTSFDYDKTGFAEMLAGYASRDTWDALVPFVVGWTGSRYQLQPMVRTAPTLPTARLFPPLITKRHRWYQTRIQLPDAIHGTGSTPPLVGYQVGAFAFVSAPQVRLITGYLAATPDRQATQTYAMRANQISLDDFALKPCYHGDPACQAPLREEDVHVPSDKLPDDSMLAGWNIVKQLWRPQVTVTASPREDCPGCDTSAG